MLLIQANLAFNAISALMVIALAAREAISYRR
jgi:hypothetical protein